MRLKMDGLTHRCKIIPKLMCLYFLDNKIISCRWKLPKNTLIFSNDEYFLAIAGLVIFNDRSKKDSALIR